MLDRLANYSFVCYTFNQRYPENEKMTVPTTTPVPAYAPCDVQSLRLFDADALAEAVRSSRFEHVQVERGDFQAVLKRIDLGYLNLESGC